MQLIDQTGCERALVVHFAFETKDLTVGIPNYLGVSHLLGVHDGTTSAMLQGS